MTGLIGIGLSGLKTHQSALNTTGNNVSNTNTPGYSRQEVIIASNPAQFVGYGYQGTGANAVDIKRISDQFLVDQYRSDTTVFNYQEAYVKHISVLDNLLADITTGLTPAMSNFFKALQGGTDDPTSIPERQLILSQSEGLVTRFQSLYARLQDEEEIVAQEMSAHVTKINSLTAGIAQLNQAITQASGQSRGAESNDLMDQRDEKLRELGELIQVTVIRRGDGQIDIVGGKGEALVIGNVPSQLSIEQSVADPKQKEISVLDPNGKKRVITQSITGGKLGGLIEYRDGILRETANSLGRLALVLADSVNQQHKLGMDLESHLGQDFFSDINNNFVASTRFISSDDNALPLDRVGRVEITDITQLTTDDYTLAFNGPTNNDYELTRLSTGEAVRAGTLPGYFPAEIEVEGFKIVLESGSYQVGDSFQIQPTRFAARDISLNIDRVEEIALASPIRTESDLGNIGNAKISPGTMLDVTSPLTNQTLPPFKVPDTLSPPMVVRFLTDDVYEVYDASDPANLVPLSPPLANQHYITGLQNELFTDDPGQMYTSAAGTDIAQIPAPGGGPFSNGYGAQTLTVNTRDDVTGVVTTSTVNLNANESAKLMAERLNQVPGISANAWTEVTIGNFAGPSLGLTINGEVITVSPPDPYDPDHVAAAINANPNLQDLDMVAVSDGTTVRLRATTGEDILVQVTGAGSSVSLTTNNAGPTTVNTGQGTQIGGYLDVNLSNGVSLFANNTNIFTLTPNITPTYRGMSVFLSGEPKAGDMFTIGYNTGGISDNRNGLALVELESTGFIGGGVNTYADGYSQMVEEIGTLTNQRKIDRDSSKALLLQSENAWHEVSGVNLDEEAGKLIQFQAAYNAAAQVVSIARETFNALLQAF